MECRLFLAPRAVRRNIIFAYRDCAIALGSAEAAQDTLTPVPAIFVGCEHCATASSPYAASHSPLSLPP